MELILALGVVFFALFTVLAVLAFLGLVLKIVLWPIQFVFRVLVLPIVGLGVGVVLFVVFGVGFVLLLGGALALLFFLALPLLFIFGLVWAAAKLASRPAV